MCRKLDIVRGICVNLEKVLYVNSPTMIVLGKVPIRSLNTIQHGRLLCLFSTRPFALILKKRSFMPIIQSKVSSPLYLLLDNNFFALVHYKGTCLACPKKSKILRYCGQRSLRDTTFSLIIHTLRIDY